MPRNYTNEHIKDRLTQEVNKVSRKLREGRTNQTSPKGYLNLPVRATDPAVTGSGEYGLYYNSGSGKVRKSYNGGAWADTTI